MTTTDCTLVLAHGAGAGPESPFLTGIRTALQDLGWPVTAVTFPYWQQVRQTGRRRPPDKPAVLDAALLDAARACSGRVVLVGKSMGARVAFRVADQAAALTVIGLGFPFHPPRRPERHRLAELTTQRRRNMIIHGTRDPFGSPDWVNAQSMPANIHLHWFEGGDHDLQRPRRQQPEPAARWPEIARLMHDFIQEELTYAD